MADMRLIDANALDLQNRVQMDMGGLCFIEDIETAIEQAPTIDPESLRPVGRWIKKKPGDKKIYCSRCGRQNGTHTKRPFCSGCGARMKGEAK